MADSSAPGDEMAGKPRVSKNFDAAKFAGLTPPLRVQATRVFPAGATPEVLTLPGDGHNYTKEQADLTSLAKLTERLGGGFYEATLTDAMGTLMAFTWAQPGIPNQQPGKAAAAAAGQAEARDAQAQAQAAFAGGWAQQPPPQAQQWGPPPGVPPSGGGWGPPGPQQWGPPGTPPPGAPAGWGSPPPGVPPWFGAPPFNPYAQSFQGPYGPPPGMPFNPYGGMPGTGGFGMPPMPFPMGGGADPETKAALQQLQFMREREAASRASEGTNQLAVTMREQMQAQAAQAREFQLEQRQALVASEARWAAILEKLAAPKTGGGDEVAELKRQIADQAARMETLRAQDTLRLEMVALREASQRDRQALEAQVAQAREAGNQTAVQQMWQQFTAAQQVAGERLMTVLQTARAKELTLPETIAMMKSLTTTERDPNMTKFLDLAFDRLMEGGAGAPTTAQIVSESVARLGETISKTATGIATAKADTETARAREQVKADAWLRSQEMRLRAAPALNGANGHAHAPAAAPPVPQGPQEPPTAQETEVQEDARYFGPLFKYVVQLRKAAAANVAPEKIAEIIAINFVAGVHRGELVDAQGKTSFQVVLDLMVDNSSSVFALANPLAAVTRALPDASGAYRHKLVEAVTKAMEEQIKIQGDGSDADEEDEAPHGDAGPAANQADGGTNGAQ